MKNKFLLSAKNLLLAATCAGILFACEKDPDRDDVMPLMVSFSVDLTDDDLVLTVVDTLDKFLVTFSEAIDPSTISGNVSIRNWSNILLRTATPPFEVALSGNANNVVAITPLAGERFLPGVTYRISISRDLKSVSNKALKIAYRGYFCMGTPASEEQMGNKTEVVVVSDIHLGDQRSMAGGYAWFNTNRDSLVNFLDYIISRAKATKTLIIAGDFFDEWLAPVDTATFGDGKGKLLTQNEFVGKIVEAHQDIVNRVKAVKAAGIDIVYIPGNHDMHVTDEDIITHFGPGTITVARDAAGLGRYAPYTNVVVEHGHRYDFFNAPDPLSNQGKSVDNVSDKSILPPGFFVTKIASTYDNLHGTTNSYRRSTEDEETATWGDVDNFHLYYYAWRLILWDKPYSFGKDEKRIKTGIDGYTSAYSLNDIVPQSAQPANGYPYLYSDIHEVAKWQARLTQNEVSPSISFLKGLMAGAINSVYKDFAFSQYITPSKAQVVVFGHTHEAKIVVGQTGDKKGAVYVNSGTWIDKRWSRHPTCTFAVISNKDSQQTVSLNRFTGSGGVEQIKKVTLKK